VKKDQRKSLIFIDKEDDKFEMLFKYYESLKGYQRNLQELSQIMGQYNNE
jgi:hypothetical protein